MSYSRDDFIQAIENKAEKYDRVAALRRAGDPRYFQHEEAIATMLAMLSQQIEVAMMEPFEKVRDATILADAALKGIIPKARAARVKIRIRNTSSAAFNVAAGRRMMDTAGNIYVVDKPVIVPAAAGADAPGEAFAEAVQETERVIEHAVEQSLPFYAVEIPASSDGLSLSSIAVSDSSGNAFEYRAGFVNCAPGERVFHVETDAYRRMYVKFGQADVVGYQPQAGEKLVITVRESAGDVRPALESPFALEYAYTPADGMLGLSMAELVSAGANPLDLAALRELCRFPSVYDENAVFMGEFDYLIRRNMPGLQFLSVWNEQLEEKVRGASMDNINRLFFSVVPVEGASVSGTQEAITKLILGADDSYRVSAVPAVNDLITIAINASIARVHDAAAVEAQIREVILDEYGIQSPGARRGMMNPQYKRVYELLRQKVVALQDDGADFTVQIEAPPTVLLPEYWRYVSQDSLTVAITPADYNIGQWGR